MEHKPSIEYHDLEAAEALVSMSFWGQRSHKPRPLTPTSDSCDSIQLHPEGGDNTKDLIALSSLVRNNETDLIIKKKIIVHFHVFILISFSLLPSVYDSTSQSELR